MRDSIIITVRREYKDGSIKEISESFDLKLLASSGAEFAMALFHYYRNTVKFDFKGLRKSR